jgi:hypothetical protein
MLSRISAAVRPEPAVPINTDGIVLPDRTKESQELSRTAERIAVGLVEQKRVDVTLPNGNERGRAIEHDEPVRTQTIQKER